MFVRARLGVSLVLAVAMAGCIAPEPVTPNAIPSASAALDGPRVEGAAALASGPFAGATVRVYRLDNDALVGEGTTDAQGHFAVAVPTEALGFALRVDVAKDGKSLGAVAGRIAGATGYRVHQAPGGAVVTGVKVNLASTLALRAFIARMKAVTVKLLPPGAKEIPTNLLAKLLESYLKAIEEAEEALAALDAAALESEIAKDVFTPLDGQLLDALKEITTNLETELNELENQTPPSTEPGPTAEPTTEAPTPEPPIVDGVEEADPTPQPGVQIEGSFDVPTAVFPSPEPLPSPSPA